MKALEALGLLGDLCASQKGMFTTAQAQLLGINRMTISRLSSHGQLESISRSVYRASTVPSTREEDLYATWLALDPSTPSYCRAFDGTGFTVSLNTAAWLQELGELKASPFAFSFPARKQTRKNIRFLKRSLPGSDITIVAGMPTTTPRRTVLDLIDDNEDLSLVASVLKDAEATGTCNDIAAEVNKRAVRCGFSDNFDLYSYLRDGAR